MSRNHDTHFPVDSILKSGFSSLREGCRVAGVGDPHPSGDVRLLLERRPPRPRDIVEFRPGLPRVIRAKGESRGSRRPGAVTLGTEVGRVFGAVELDECVLVAVEVEVARGKWAPVLGQLARDTEAAGGQNVPHDGIAGGLRAAAVIYFTEARSRGC